MRVFDPEKEWDDLDPELADNRPEYHPQLWRPAREIDATTTGRNGVPYYDDDLDHDPDAAPVSYQAWRNDETMVVSGPVGDWAKENPDRVGFHASYPWYQSRRLAREAMEERFGPVLEVYRIANRYCFRHYKEKRS